MKLAIIGASGKAGQFILQEALDRKLDVTAIVRNKANISQPVKVIEKEVFDLETADINAFDVIINAFGAKPGDEELHVKAGRHLIKIFTNTTTRLLVVGGAGSLYVDPEKITRVMDTPEFPAAFLPTASNQGQNLTDLQVSPINWTFLSPSAFFNPDGIRTGHYVAGRDHLLANKANESYISYADYAIAMIDEAVHPKHQNERFTVVGESK
ncbi:NAD(P)-dependent oxidoreductase [Brochothrix campestris]|uniref:NAD(P)-binding domain-containing protein n=1 Tax=Brochothrix campestris FSL F6-1037 TaxID=1265861 RepID=W7CVK7_9LIST|nr:NAD(P)-dependent oxidoreductase [Brochothrix campestris]EUJ39871.1 hypothetical protein BCAMP_06705 [Brochothrix campestris FSL F6-1037]